MPMSSPPGLGTTARPVRASKGPRKRIEARISWADARGTSEVIWPAADRLRTPCSPRSTLTPIALRMPSALSTSASWGTFSSRQGSRVSKLAAMIGRAAFLAPLTRRVPLRGDPPWICNECVKGLLEDSGRSGADRPFSFRASAPAELGHPDPGRGSLEEGGGFGEVLGRKALGEQLPSPASRLLRASLVDVVGPLGAAGHDRGHRP